MQTALAISLAAIFLVLLVQFRTLSDPLLVMCSIPLTLFGAMLGLVLTRYPFGFTAFVGLMSLCGIVVRNAIILVDCIKEKRRDGLSLEQAATEAGERRLRPIFLTTMAAAVGVTPMILSGSSLWGPLASVIAVGLISSMFFTLIVVPVLYVLVKSHASMPPSVVVGILLVLALGTGSVHAAPRKITLPEAIDLARKQNVALKIARARVRENQQKTATARADYFPQLSNETTLMGLSDRELVTMPAGAIENVPGLGPFPTHNVTFDQGSNMILLDNTTLSQPLTQLFKIHEGVQVAAANQRVTEAEFRKAEDDVVLAVHQLYFALLVATKQVGAMQARIAADRETLREAENSVRAGNTLEVAAIGGRAALLKSRQSLLAAENQVADLNAEMDDLLGLPLDTELELAEAGTPPGERLTREQYLAAALDHNPELQAAKETVSKARSAVRAAEYEYIPNIGAFARQTYESGVPFLAHNFGAFGLQMTWSVFDWGKRKGVVGERQAQLTQAEENLRHITDRIAVDVGKACRKLERTQMMVDVAQEALALRQEGSRISADQLKAGLTSDAKNAEAAAETRGAEVDELQARLAYELALAEIARITGSNGR
jgi:outer membrane protein TolC